MGHACVCRWMHTPRAPRAAPRGLSEPSRIEKQPRAPTVTPQGRPASKFVRRRGSAYRPGPRRGPRLAKTCIDAPPARPTALREAGPQPNFVPARLRGHGRRASLAPDGELIEADPEARWQIA